MVTATLYIEGGGKGKVSFELLARVDPARVEAACSHAEAFLNQLRALRRGSMA